MQVNRAQGPTIIAANAAIAAFQVAVVQQKQFEENMARVAEKQVEARKDAAKKADRIADVVDIKHTKIAKDTGQANANAEKSVPVEQKQAGSVNLTV